MATLHIAYQIDAHKDYPDQMHIHNLVPNLGMTEYICSIMDYLYIQLLLLPLSYDVVDKKMMFQCHRLYL